MSTAQDYYVPTESLIEEQQVNPDAKVHIINPPMNKHIVFLCGSSEPQDIVDYARVNRMTIVGLCGWHFIPSHNPEDVDGTCDPCLKVAADILAQESETN